MHSSLFQARERFLHHFLFSCLLMLLFYVFFDFYHQIYWGGVTDIICLTLVTVSLLSLKRQGLQGWQIHLTLFGGICLFSPLFILESFGDTGIYWLSALPVIVFMLGGTRIGLWWGGVYFTALILSMLLAYMGLLELAYSWSQVLFMFLVTMFTGVVSYFFARFLEQAELNNLHYQQKLELASEAKTNFLSVMSHELRTPLHGIIGMQELLIQDAQNLSSEQREWLQLSLHSSKSLKALLNDVLDLAKVEAGHIELVEKPFDVLYCMQESLIPFVLTAREKGLQLSLQLDDIPQQMIGDELRVRQVLLNLLGNSIKFTDRGTISLHVENLGNEIKFSVRDTGIGIHPEQLASIFEPFMQCGELQSKLKGSGLGTSIVKNFVELMGGKVSVTSTLNEGSCFSFVLPLKAVSDQRYNLFLQNSEIVTVKEDKQLTPTDYIESALRVLLVEDNVISQKVTSKQLRRAGMQVDIAQHGEEALRLFSKHQYQVILTDLGMPVMDGISLTRKVRELESNSVNHIVIIGLSAHALDSVIEGALAAGMDYFLSKPVEPEKILQCVLKLESQTLP